MRRLFLVLVALMLPLSAHAESISPLQITDGWSVPPLSGMTVGVAYITITNHHPEARTLTKITGDVSKTIELHTHELKGDIMKMRQLHSLALLPHKTITFAPGGLHLMLIGLKQELKAGDRFPITLHFAEGDSITTEITVKPREGAATEKAPHAEHHH